ncbi:MAG: hypothetical protein MZV63_26570 [Marinilabiliales bacterium]|nr:hypothetical protein [Marinilabiliales bacterium]
MHDKLNVTSIFVTHDQNEAMEISDKIIVISKGRVEQIGAARDVYEETFNKFVASFIGNINIIDAHLDGDAIFVHGTQATASQAAGYDAPSGDIVLLVRPERYRPATRRRRSACHSCRGHRRATGQRHRG